MYRSKRPIGKTGWEQDNFNNVLKSAKEALDSVNIPFHLHAGTALGAHRERNFIKHDHDIDLAIFYKDVNTYYKLNKLVKAMENNGFEITSKLGKLPRGKEIQFWKDDVPLDIFWVYEGKYRGEDYYIVSSYYGECDKLRFKTCIWGYRPYEVQKINFLGETYNIIPEKTLVDQYGEDWKVPKKFGYHAGISQGLYKGFLKDYYDPKDVSKKIAFCFLLYDTVKHGEVWEKFFNQDNYPVKSYNIYSHLKCVTDKTPEWIKNNSIETIETEWCGESLVYAWIDMIKEGLKDKTNKYFLILSGECIPLFTFWETYKKVTASKKSRMNINKDTGLYSETNLYYSDQWVVLNRKCAEILTELVDTRRGQNFEDNIRDRLELHCPDETYPINWFVNVLGHPRSKKFKEQIQNKITTYTYWGENSLHPLRFNYRQVVKMKKDICESGALFARKFNSKAARNFSMTCGQK